MIPRKVLDRYPVVKRIAKRLIATVPLSLRLGRTFWEWYAFFEESEHWSRSKLTSFQMDCLRTLLSELYRTSGFYQSRLSGIDFSSLDTLEQFQDQVPLLTREQFRENFSEIRSSHIAEKRLSKVSTSGTTGMALQFYHSVKDNAREWAAICHQWRRVGYFPSESIRAEFRGLTSHGKLVEVFPRHNMIRCSILHLKKEHIHLYSDEIRKYKVKFLHGYPSAIYLLARGICESGVDFPQPTAILLASEYVHDWQLVQIQTAFPNSLLFAHYGCAERTVLGGWCEYRKEYHILPQYSLVEVDQSSSEIIGTNLYNTINGFVRYRMSDTVVEVDEEYCPDCGRSYTRFIKIGGRFEDYLFSTLTGWIPMVSVNLPFKRLKEIRETQLLQKEESKILIRYTVREGAEHTGVEAEVSQILSGMHHLFGNEMSISFERVDDFPRDAGGKFKWIICELDKTPRSD